MPVHTVSFIHCPATTRKRAAGFFEGKRVNSLHIGHPVESSSSSCFGRLHQRVRRTLFLFLSISALPTIYFAPKKPTHRSCFHLVLHISPQFTALEIWWSTTPSTSSFCFTFRSNPMPLKSSSLPISILLPDLVGRERAPFAPNHPQRVLLGIKSSTSIHERADTQHFCSWSRVRRSDNRRSNSSFQTATVQRDRLVPVDMLPAWSFW